MGAPEELAFGWWAMAEGMGVRPRQERPRSLQAAFLRFFPVLRSVSVQLIMSPAPFDLASPLSFTQKSLARSSKMFAERVSEVQTLQVPPGFHKVEVRTHCEDRCHFRKYRELVA